jgi:hypothetical protein
LSNDLPPYDPIKHKTGQYQGYNYDPVIFWKFCLFNIELPIKFHTWD